MTKELRPYQQEALTTLRQRLKDTTHPLLVNASVGAGKSLIIASLLQVIERANWRALCLTMNSTLIGQNAQTYRDQGGTCGIYCTGLGEKDHTSNIIFASPNSIIQGIKNKSPICSIGFNLIVVDEAHNCNPHDRKSMYMQILNHYGLLSQTERYSYRIVGLTGTPYRGKSISIVGEKQLFKEQVCNITAGWLIEHGYLVPPVFGAHHVDSIDMSSVRVDNTGKFKHKNLQQAVDKDKRLTGFIMDEIVSIVEAGRKGAFIFASTVKHVHECMKYLPPEQSAYITAQTPHEKRKEILSKAKAGIIKYLVNVQTLLVGVDVPSFDTCAWLRPTESLTLFVQGIGRVLRLHPGKENCIASGQRVLTDVGLVAIENITKNMRIWDGVEFVSHCGTVLRGKQKVITYAGLTATEDHKIWTKEGWASFGKCFERRMPLCVTGNDGIPIKLSCGYLRSDNEKRKKSTGILKNSMSRMSCNTRKISLQSKKENCWMQEMWKKKKCRQTMLRRSKMVNSKMHSSKATLYKSKRFQLSTLWSQRNSIQFQKSECNGSMDIRQSWRPQRIAYRSDQQQWSLRNRKFKNNYIKNKYEQQKTQQRNEKNALTEIGASRNKIFRQHNSRNVFNRNDRRRYNQEILSKFIQAEREVWDILNCGPRNRFTCEGILVSNCLILDYAGNVDRHGDIDDPLILQALSKKDQDDPDYCIPCYHCEALNKITARRCIGTKNNARCDYYFIFKPCDSCGVENDITARHCRACEHELIDPNKKLKIPEGATEVAVKQAQYWVTCHIPTSTPIINARYLTAQGDIFECFFNSSDKAKNICYYKFMKQHFKNASDYYPSLTNFDIISALIQSDDIRTPHTLYVKKDLKNQVKITNKVF